METLRYAVSKAYSQGSQRAGKPVDENLARMRPPKKKPH
jgi:hypothetical protein